LQSNLVLTIETEEGTRLAKYVGGNSAARKFNNRYIRSILPPLINRSFLKAAPAQVSLLINRLSNNADSVNPFFSTPLHALREERHFALVEGFAFPTVGSLVIRFRSEVSIRPMHLFDP